jgi:hypothetical protein
MCKVTKGGKLWGSGKFFHRWDSKTGCSHLRGLSLLSYPAPSCSSHYPCLYPSQGWTTKKTWDNQDQTGKVGSPWWEGNDLKAPKERTPYLSPSRGPWGTPGHVWLSFVSLWVYRDLYTSQTSIKSVSHLSKNEQASPETETSWRKKPWVVTFPKHSGILHWDAQNRSP